MTALSNLVNSSLPKFGETNDDIVEATGLTPSPNPLSSLSSITNPIRPINRILSPIPAANRTPQSLPTNLSNPTRTFSQISSLPSRIPSGLDKSVNLKEKFSPNPLTSLLNPSTFLEEEADDVIFFSKAKSMINYPLPKVSPVTFGEETIDFKLDDAEYMPEIIANLHIKEKSQDMYEFMKKYSLIPDKFPLTRRDISNLYPVGITIENRNKLIDWIYYIYYSYQKRLNLNLKILFATISLVDRCLIHPIFNTLQKDDLSLLAMTCMRLIVKLEDRRIETKIYAYIASDLLTEQEMNILELQILANIGTFSEIITFYTWYEILEIVLPTIILNMTLYLAIIAEFYPELYVNYLPSEICAGLVYIALISNSYKWLNSLDSYLNVNEIKALEVAQYIHQLMNERRVIQSMREFKILLPEITIPIKYP